MATNILSRDSEAVRALLSHWLYRAAGVEPDFPEPFPDLAAEKCVCAALDDCQEAPRQHLCLPEVFGAGVNFGIAVALAILDDPFSSDSEQPLARINEAILAADKELRSLAESARDDAAIVEKSASTFLDELSAKRLEHSNGEIDE